MDLVLILLAAGTRSSPTSLAPWSNRSFGDDLPLADSPYEGPMAGSLLLDCAFSLKSPESNILVHEEQDVRVHFSTGHHS